MTDAKEFEAYAMAVLDRVLARDNFMRKVRSIKADA